MFPIDRSSFFRRTASAATVFAAVGFALALGGCGRRVVIAPSEGQSNAEEETPTDHCGKLLRNAIGMAQPDRLGVSTERRQVSDMFNQWRADCGEASLPALGPVASKSFKPLVSEGEFKAMAQGRVSERDADLLRTATLLKRTGDVVVRSADRDVDRVNLLFLFVIRNVALAAPSSEPIPLTPYDVLLLGRGTAEERAWLFAELLRQLRIDAVILKPATAKPEATAKVDTEPKKEEEDSKAAGETAATGTAPDGDTSGAPGWLVGVLLDEPQKPVYLFDMWLGQAIPAPDDATFPPRPATLEQVLAKPDVLTRLADESKPYRFPPDAFKSLRVELIAAADTSLPRMQHLQSVLTGENAVVLFDPIDDDGESPGVLSRVKAFGGDHWKEADISVWTYPETTLTATEHLNDRQRQRLRIRRHPLDAPISISQEKVPPDPKDAGKTPPPPPQTRLVFSNPKKTQLKTRIAQLLGDRQNAVRSYNLVRADGRLDPRMTPPEYVRMHARAEEDAFFWTGICQFESGEYDPAALTFGDYLRRYPQGEWADHAREMQARAYAENSKYAAALQVLGKLSEADPARVAHEVLLKTFRTLRESRDQPTDAPAAKPPEKAEVKPAEKSEPGSAK